MQFEDGVLLVENNGDPIHPSGRLSAVGVARPYCELADIAPLQQFHRALRENLRAALAIRHSSALPLHSAQSAGLDIAFLRQFADRIVQLWIGKLRQVRQTGLLARAFDGLRDQFCSLLRRTRRNLAREIFDDIEPARAPDGCDARNIKRRIKKVLTMRRREDYGRTPFRRFAARAARARPHQASHFLSPPKTYPKRSRHD